MRLKVGANQHELFVDDVSIPEGAIEGEVCHSRIRPKKQVSIPEGAIEG